MSQLEHLNHLKIPFQTINKCTDKFSKANLIGKGGYGRVYKGILSWANYRNKQVAVKRLHINGLQGNKEFYTEVTMLSSYRHKNIVTLVGYSDDMNEMILVYEYACHGSLDAYLIDSKRLHQLSWQNRLNICIGVASAIEYLHNHVATQHRVIHRDIKSANILLDEEWNPKLSDFGLSTIGLANQTNTFLITNVAGTHGYCDPHCERTCILTKESDVYSFGVVLFEVLCGRIGHLIEFNGERQYLHHLARTCYENGELDKIVDYRIKDHINGTKMREFSAIAYQCLQHSREKRPTIHSVVVQLTKLKETQSEDNVIEIPQIMFIHKLLRRCFYLLILFYNLVGTMSLCKLLYLWIECGFSGNIPRFLLNDFFLIPRFLLNDSSTELPGYPFDEKLRRWCLYPVVYLIIFPVFIIYTVLSYLVETKNVETFGNLVGCFVFNYVAGDITSLHYKLDS